MSAPERRAYKQAWAVRQRTGDPSRQGLLEALRAHNVSEAWFDDERLHEWLMSCWDRGVPPGRMGLEGLRQIPGHARPIIDAYRELLRAFR